MQTKIEEIPASEEDEDYWGKGDSKRDKLTK